MLGIGWAFSNNISLPKCHGYEQISKGFIGWK